MYIVVKYINYRKEQSFEIKYVTEVLEYAKQIAYNLCLKSRYNNHDNYRVTTTINEYYLWPENEIIVEYTNLLVEFEEDGNMIIDGYESSEVFAVLKHINKDLENMVKIDESTICNINR